ncbi:hypothetical protein [Sphingomonas sp.]|uniref:hypothetical protein n=1 Tax=Sphingomonas sp. TaxID=28214 RepID=UPI00286C50EB|nr:hypothetical protein [Sphingomonas sp.]
MGAEHPQTTEVEAHKATTPRESFWRTLPGILTAAGTFLAGLTGLAAVFFGNRDGASAPAGAASDRYIASKAPDGFVAMRTLPSKDGVLITKISVGNSVRCGTAHPNDKGYPWRRCKDDEGHTGYVSDIYLEKG